MAKPEQLNTAKCTQP